MDLAGYVINAVLVEGKSVTEVCEDLSTTNLTLEPLSAFKFK